MNLVHLRIQLGQRWDLPSLQWAACLFGALLAGGLLIVAVPHATEAWRRHGGAEAARVSAQSVPQAHRDVAPDVASDFTSKLPREASLPDVVQTLQRAAVPLGVTLRSLQARERSPAADALGRSELVVTLRGDYIKLRQVLTDVLSRYPHVTLSTLRASRVEGGVEVEAIAMLSVWTRPLPPVVSGAP